MAGALAVLATGPAARATLPLFELFPSSANTPGSGFGFLSVRDPTNKLVATKRSETFPQLEGASIGAKGGAEIFRQRVHYPASNTFPALPPPPKVAISLFKYCSQNNIVRWVIYLRQGAILPFRRNTVY